MGSLSVQSPYQNLNLLGIRFRYHLCTTIAVAVFNLIDMLARQEGKQSFSVMCQQKFLKTLLSPNRRFLSQFKRFV